MANPIIKILRGHTAPPTLEAGRIAIDQTNKNLYVGIDDGAGGTINEIVGGSGTFATKTYVNDAVSAGTGSLGTMSTQNADSVAITGGAIDGTPIGLNAREVGRFTHITSGEILIEGSGNGLGIREAYIFPYSQFNGGQTNGTTVLPQNGGYLATEDYVDTKISALGNAFQYVGTLNGGATEGQATSVASQDNNQPGDYYKVAVAGYFVYAPGGTAIYANVNDGLVVNSDFGLDLIDNTNSTVAGTSNEISVTGATDTGYTVAIAPEFSGRVSTAETEIDDLQSKTQNISLAGTTAGTTGLKGHLVVQTDSSLIPEFTVESIYGGGAGSALLRVNGSDHSVVLGGNWPMTEVSVRSTKLVGVDGSFGTPAIENFIIDGGEY